MSWVKDNVIDQFTGAAGEDAAERAAEIQAQSGQEAIELQREALEQLREDLAPGRDAFAPALEQLTGAAGFQDSDIVRSPLFQAVADETQRRLFANQAAQGKLGSGGTASALQDALATQAMAAQAQRFGQLFDVARLGQSSAAQSALAGTATATNIGGLLTDIGAARGAGVVGGQTSRAAGFENIFGAIQGAVSGGMGGPGGGGGGLSGALQGGLQGGMGG